MTRQYLISKIGEPLPAEIKVADDQDVTDIMRRIKSKHKRTAREYDKIADDFDGGSTYQIAERLWKFCKSNIPYKRESLDRQNVSSPQTILTRGCGDCKSYALFIGGVLDALNRQGKNIKWKYRFASDDVDNEIPGHVFVVIEDGGYEIWVDPVLSEFNQDHFFPYYQDRKVRAMVSGCNCHAVGYLDVMGAAGDPNTDLLVEAPPAGSTIIADIPGWPADVPHLLLTPDNRVVFSFLPMTRKPTANDLSYVMTGLQSVYNSYVPTAGNIFSYVNPLGNTYAPFLADMLYNSHYGKSRIAISSQLVNNLLKIPQAIQTQQKQSGGFLFDTIAPLFQYLGYAIPIAGQVAAIVTATSKASDAAAAQKTAAENALLTKQVAQEAGQSAGSYVDANGNLIDPVAVAAQRKKILIMAAAAVALLLILKH